MATFYTKQFSPEAHVCLAALGATISQEYTGAYAIRDVEFEEEGRGFIFAGKCFRLDGPVLKLASERTLAERVKDCRQALDAACQVLEYNPHDPSLRDQFLERVELVLQTLGFPARAREAS